MMRRAFHVLLGALAMAGGATATLAATYVATPGNAADQAAKLFGGDTLILKPGVYRETIELRNRRGTEAAPIVIRGDTAEGRVILRGSDVLTRWKLLSPGLYAHPLARQTTQIFVNGTAYRQIGGTVFDGYPTNRDSEYHRLHRGDGGVWPARVSPRAADELPLRTFMYDDEHKRVLVRTDEDLGKATVEASMRPRVLFAENVRHLIVENLELQHANTSATTRGGALVVFGEHITLRNLKATWNDLTGLQFGGDHITLEDSEAHYNGQTGVTAHGRWAKVRRVKAMYNNRRGFNKWWEAGGFKFIGIGHGALRASSITDCQALHNGGDGIWLDWKNDGVDIGGNLSAYNQGFGIHFEASTGGVIHDNILVGNVQRGIYLSSSSHTVVRSNLVVGNGLEGIASILQAGIKDEQGVPFTADGIRVEDNIVAWNDNGALILPEGGKGTSDRNVFWGEGAPSRFSVGYTGILNPPAYGIRGWHKMSGQDTRSWWVNAPRPKRWDAYLQAKSTDLGLLKELVAESRAAPPARGSERPQTTAPARPAALSRSIGESDNELLPSVGPSGL